MTPPEVLRSLQTLKELPSGVEIAREWSKSHIPADWKLQAILARDTGCIELEQFAFYSVPDGRVAEAHFHPMNGWDCLFIAVRTVENSRERWAELIGGEPFKERSYLGYGRYNNRKGRMVKASRIDTPKPNDPFRRKWSTVK